MCERNYCITEMFPCMIKRNQPYKFVLISFKNTDNVSHQNLFISPHLPKHAGQNDMFLL